MTDGVTKRYELTATRAVILDIVTSNITDPLTGQEARTTTDHWFLDGFPNSADLGKPPPGGWRFPFVEIPFSDFDAENKTVDGSKQSVIHTIAIECHSRTRLQANQLAEEIRNILYVTGQSELRKAALQGPVEDRVSSDVDFIGGNKYYTKIIEYDFKRFD